MLDQLLWLVGGGSPALLIFGFLSCVILWRAIVGTRTVRLLDEIPGPRGYPIVGNLLELIMPTTEITNHALKRLKEYGPILRLWLGPIPIVSVASAEHVETILGSTEEIQKSFAYRMIQPWLGDGLLTSFGPRWFKHRKMITPTFHFKILDSFISSFEANSQVMVEKLRLHAEKGDVFDICPNITTCALDIICETAMGVNLNAQENTESAYIAAVYRISNLIAERFQRIYLHPDNIYKMTRYGREFAKCIETLHNFTEGVIKERKEQRRKEIKTESHDLEGKKKKAFLDLLLDSNSDLTDQDLREEVDTFMFEGHDTTTAGISWSVYLLGSHPEIQRNVAEEVLSLWPPGEPLTMMALNDMKLLERVIKEALRIYPSVPFISRTLQNDMKFGKYLAPGGIFVDINIYGLHHDESVFPDPEKFDPDRFLAENIQARHPYAYVPFSAGSRNCIGQKFALLEEKSVIASLVRDYMIESMDKREDIRLASELVLRPHDGIRIRIKPRK